jgi:citrate lyase subunit beta/citryl-CoA lyase
MTAQLPDDLVTVEQRISSARSVLFVPGDRPDRVRKALGSGADAVIVDLEDAVRPEMRPYARSVVRDVVPEARGTSPSVLLLARVNPYGPDDFIEDVAAALEGQVDGIVVPKFVPGPAAADMDNALAAIESDRSAGHPTPVVALIESAAGLLGLSHPTDLPARVTRFAFGAADFYADLRISYQQSGIHTDLAMTTLVIASAAVGLAAPLDSPHFAIGDDAGLVSAVERARERGFAGALCIHPNQVAIVNASFNTTALEYEWASKVLAAWAAPEGSQAGAIRVDGELIDEAMVRRARQIIG